MNEKQKQIIEVLTSGGKMFAEKIGKKVGLSYSEALEALRELAREGKAKMNSHGAWQIVK